MLTALSYSCKTVQNFVLLLSSSACPGLDGDSGVCSGHGNCSSGIDGDGSCACEVMQ